jgi:opacity protein-like surface antigen
MYGLSAGLSYQVSKNTSLDFGYQYISAPNMKYYAVSDDGISSRKGISSNQIKVGLRYDLW